MQCPKCKLHNPEGAMRCDCGYDFDTGKMEESFLPEKERKKKLTPEQIHQFCYWTLFAAGIIHLALGILMLFGLDPLGFNSNGFVDIALGVISLLLGYLTKRKVMAALITAVILYAANGAALIYQLFTQSGRSSIRALILNVLIIIIFIRGIDVLRTMKEKANDPPESKDMGAY